MSIQYCMVYVRISYRLFIDFHCIMDDKDPPEFKHLLLFGQVIPGNDEMLLGRLILREQKIIYAIYKQVVGMCKC